MARPQRLEIIRQIAERRGAAMICYVTGDRENVNTRIAPDVTRVIYRHLEMLGEKPAIDLFLYTRGGDVLTPWRLVHLIREYTPRFAVLVPFRAYSAGTLLSLGADEIIMGKMGELGPIDPSVINAFNPQDPGNPSARVPVNIEDVYSYLGLAVSKGGVTEEADKFRVFALLAEKIHPLALGNVHRNYLLIRTLAHRLLDLRQHQLSDDNIDRIVDNLTEKLYAHNHMISRREAACDIGLPVVNADKEFDRLMWALYEDFAADLKLAEPFNPADMLRGEKVEFEVPGGLVESEMGQDLFIFTGVVERKEFPEPGQVSVNIIRQDWRSMI